ncbi:unnamed protein product [Polarella glacialis]|nr:unnamed protein product [Polarella glacialis]
MKGSQVVFHTASIIDIRPVPSPAMRRVNVDGVRNTIECCDACGVKTLVYTSSMEVVAGVDATGVAREFCGGPEDDESLPIPARHHLPYATTKAEAEALVLAAHRSGKLLTTALRSAYIVGPECIGIKIELVKAQKQGGRYISARMPANLSCVHPKNCALAHLLAAEKADESSVGGQAFFVSDFESNTTDINVMVCEANGISATLLPVWVAYIIASLMHVYYRCMFLLCSSVGVSFAIPMDVVDINAMRLAWRNICFSTRKAHEALGYGPSLGDYVSKEECLRQTLDWAKGFWLNLQSDAVRKTH